MESRSFAFYTGLFLLILGLTAVIVAVWVGERTEPTEPYLVYTSQSVTGLVPFSTVYFRGMEVGQVESIAFADDGSGEIHVGIRVRKGLPLTESAYANLRVLGITGMSEINLFNEDSAAPALETSDSRPGRIPLRPSLLQNLADQGEALLAQVDGLLNRLAQTFDDENRQRIDNILKSVESGTAELERLSRQVEPVLDDLPGIGRDAREALAQLESAAGRLNRLAADADRLRVMAESAGEEVLVTTLPRVNDTLEQLERAARHINQLATNLENDPSALLFGPPSALPESEDTPR